MNQSKFIKDKNDFEETLYCVKQTFHYEQRLPNQVYKVPFQRNVVIDFDDAMSHVFWYELEKWMNVSDDSFVIMAVLDPDPVDYYYKEFSQYNWCILQKETTADEYWNTLNQGPDESPADAILFNSEVVIWLSPSRKWAMWGERSYGICILSFNDDAINDFENELWFTMEQAIADLISLNFRNYTVPEEIISKLMKFYSDM